MREHGVALVINLRGKLVDHRLCALFNLALLLCLLVLDEAGELVYLLLQRLHLWVYILILCGWIVTDCPNIHTILVGQPGNSVLRVFLQIVIGCQQLPDSSHVIHASPCKGLPVRGKEFFKGIGSLFESCNALCFLSVVALHLTIARHEELLRLWRHSLKLFSEVLRPVLRRFNRLRLFWLRILFWLIFSLGRRLLFLWFIVHRRRFRQRVLFCLGFRV